jgi:hypothetical protein
MLQKRRFKKEKRQSNFCPCLFYKMGMEKILLFLLQYFFE